MDIAGPTGDLKYNILQVPNHPNRWASTKEVLVIRPELFPEDLDGFCRNLVTRLDQEELKKSCQIVTRTQPVQWHLSLSRTKHHCTLWNPGQPTDPEVHSAGPSIIPVH
ncbi:hypothetical protein DPEC_G00214630 [Dallia pectoralis]|uniref:Uncharacterized protein n=1 Tax=Dallia pectoralis TaxID=75939 RepID=A0ACC2G257_DALPE|nr:hypothetical protein DPEC_G00214630 [Dallia pectoralis]